MRALMVWVERLSGAEAVPERFARRRWFPFAVAAWWIVLLLLVVAFAGRTAKFVYVDF